MNCVGRSLTSIRKIQLLPRPLYYCTRFLNLGPRYLSKTKSKEFLVANVVFQSNVLFKSLSTECLIWSLFQGMSCLNCF